MSSRPTASPATPLRQMRLIVLLLAVTVVMVTGVALLLFPESPNPWAFPTLYSVMILVVGLGSVCMAIFMTAASLKAFGTLDSSALARGRINSLTVLRGSMCAMPGLLGVALAPSVREGDRTCLALSLLIAVPALLLVAYPSRSRVESWLSGAKPEVRAEVLRDFFGDAAGATPQGTGGGITRY